MTPTFGSVALVATARALVAQYGLAKALVYAELLKRAIEAEGRE